MKKVAVFFVIVLAVVAIASIGYLMRPGAPLDAASFVPAESVLFAQMPNIVETRRRWKKTALYQIAREPEVQAFLERPKSKVPQMAAIRTNTDRWLRASPRDAFIAVTSITEQTPKFVAGFSFKGAGRDVEAVRADLKARVQAAWPAGKSDIIKHGEIEIETFSFANTVLATAFKHHWCLFADDLDLLKTTLDRMDAGADAKTLRSNAAFQKSLARLPKDLDALIFVQPGTVMDRLIGLLKATGQQVDTQQLEGMRNIAAVSGAIKLEGEQIRDAMFVLKPGSQKQSAMPRNSLAFTSTDTLIYYAGQLGKPASFKLPDPALDTTGVLRMLAEIKKSLDEQGLTLAGFTSAFSPEIGMAVDWTPNAPQPSLLLSMDVRDPAKARKFADFFTSGQLGSPAWVAREIDGTRFYCMQPLGMALATPTIALTDKVMLAGLSYDSVNAAIKRATGGSQKLDASPIFQQAAKFVATPTSAFGYIDSRSLFERLFGTLRPFLTYGSLFVPNSSNYVDLKKLPSTEAISKHLSPIVTSKTSDESGVLVESVGPMTYNQLMLGLGATAGAAAAPMLKTYLQDPAGKQKKADPAVVPVPTPAASPAAPPEPKAP